MLKGNKYYEKSKLVWETVTNARSFFYVTVLLRNI